MKSFLVQKLGDAISNILKGGRVVLIKTIWNPVDWDKNTLVFTKKLILDQSGQTVPDEFIEILTAINRPHIHWKQKETGLEGEFCIETAITVMTDFLPKLDYTQAPESIIQNKKQLAVIDRHPEIKNNQYVLIDRTNLDAAQLWYYDNGIFYPMVLTYPQYVSRAAEVCGFLHWQLFFCEFKNQGSEIAEKLTDMLAKIQEVFPEINPDEYTAHIQRVKVGS